ncbi:hypothetical protein A3752_18630 [Oleiphilus sp. HI0081]|jgi:hypothetical protein|nr:MULTISPECIES: hypothetical protein [unclassified Oleiphilus]KZY75283.1 hypothetical protein A3741_12450 [Oleiphilus sp. HI0069]KZY76296.1 hypothetical protein A3740_13170 [Oleiphilus sp. HI0068]KZY88833.1 hypothetical protein A3743_10360 [Oleiphilus sp. HI0072]KZZ13411.1 hypothetical protein A3749_05780 [Oleiphilus sp. HI0078]KZZ29632.1 hypothetical protein A3752_18630 [Oleiphilus sp. HI0081]KZZ45964.1 hypothetical protein A3755_19375 [Oleiphilus sp. HI0085]
MKSVSTGLKKILIFTGSTVALSIGYYIYALSLYPPVEERETFLAEIGEGLGEIGLWLLVFIYARTLIKLFFGKGAIAKRLLPEYSIELDPPLIDSLINLLNRTHVYFGIGAVAIILLHIALMGLPMHILFFPAVLALVIWQGLFGIFISWRYSPRELKKLSYLVHAQLFTGVMIGVFSYFGHLLIDD